LKSIIKNKADYGATSIGLSGGIGGTLGRDGDGNVKAGAPGPQVTSVDHVGANIPVILSASGEASSITQSGISGATVKINDEAKQEALTGQTAAQTVASICSGQLIPGTTLSFSSARAGASPQLN